MKHFTVFIFLFFIFNRSVVAKEWSRSDLEQLFQIVKIPEGGGAKAEYAKTVRLEKEINGFQFIFTDNGTFTNVSVQVNSHFLCGPFRQLTK